MGPKATDSHYAQLVRSIGALHKENYIKTLESAVPYDRQLPLESIDVPSLYLFGQHDPLCSPELGREMAKRTPGGKFLEVRSTGHLINIEQPEGFHHATLDFLYDVEKSLV